MDFKTIDASEISWEQEEERAEDGTPPWGTPMFNGWVENWEGMGNNDIISYRGIKKVDVQNEFCRIYIGKSLGS